jgi:hypothetical protein
MGPEPARGAQHVQALSKTDPTDGRPILVLTFSLPWELDSRVPLPEVRAL